jgi:hypothetical protein
VLSLRHLAESLVTLPATLAVVLTSGSGRGACWFMCLGVIPGNRRPAQLDSSRQLSFLIEGSADRGCIGLGDDEHPKGM